LKLTTVGSGVEVEDDNEDDDDTQPSNAGGHCDGAGLEAMGALTMTNLKIEMFNEIPIKEIPIKEMRADSLTELDLKGKGDGVVGDHGPKDGYDGYSSCQTPQRRLSEPKKTQMGREKRSQLRADKSPIPPSTKRHRPSANLRSTKRAR